MDTSVTLFSFAYIVILIVPGIIFKRFFFQGAFSGQFNTGIFADRIITSLFWGILVQIISILTFSRIINVSYLDWRIMLQTLYRNVVENKLPNATPDQLLYVLFYAIYSVVLAAVLGFFLFKVIRMLGLDLKFPAFRFLNQWHYYFKGEILRTPEFKMTGRGRVLSTEVDLMLRDNDGKSNLFSGLLTQYTLNAKNELDTLYLTGASRFSQSQDGMKHIPGDIFIIPFSTVQNMNIRYNFEVRQNTEVLKYVALSFLGLVLIVTFIFPWLIELDAWRKIFGAVTLFFSWLHFSILMMSFFPANNGTQPLSKRARIVTSILLIGFIVASLFVFNQI
ncbi:hypothetical protein ACSBL2_22425 [Pedobacter sp. AW31-3R]|uniref:hypothetical protein n=1 Tax=Pedobacter sp. AW31-3R TaxID=3445781 RepID=UPI003F9FC973